MVVIRRGSRRLYLYGWIRPRAAEARLPGGGRTARLPDAAGPLPDRHEAAEPVVVPAGGGLGARAPLRSRPGLVTRWERAGWGSRSARSAFTERRTRPRSARPRPTAASACTSDPRSGSSSGSHRDDGLHRQGLNRGLGTLGGRLMARRVKFVLQAVAVLVVASLVVLLGWRVAQQEEGRGLDDALAAGKRPVRARVHARQPGGRRHHLARRLPRQGSCRQLLGLVVRAVQGRGAHAPGRLGALP